MYKRNPPGLLSQSSLEPALPATPTRATHKTRNKSLSQNLSMDFRGKGMNLIASLVCLPSLMATPFPGSSDNDVCQYTCLDNGACEVLYTGRPRSGNTKGSCFPASFGGRCSGTPPECQDCNKVKNCEKSLEPRGQPQPLCECINPFVGTRNAYRGNPESLCGSGGPGFCYVPCNADCSDIQPTSSASRCQSVKACVQKQQPKRLPKPQPKPQPRPQPKPQPKPVCDCINPFVGTPYEYRGDSDALCGAGGPGFCYVPCNADCSDIQPASSGSRCQSVNACDVQHGIKLLAAPGK